MGKKPKPTKTHLMLEAGPWSLCGRYLRNWPGMKQTFSPKLVTCIRCQQEIARQLEVGNYDSFPADELPVNLPTNVIPIR